MNVDNFLLLLEELNQLEDEHQREETIGSTLKALNKKNKLPLYGEKGKVIFVWFDQDNLNLDYIYIRSNNLNWERDGYLGKYYNGKYRLAIRTYHQLDKLLYKFEIDDNWLTDPLNINVEWDGFIGPALHKNMNSVIHFLPDPSWPEGRMVKHHISFEFEGMSISKDLFVVLPPDYDRSRRTYPVLYLNHGEHYATYLEAQKNLIQHINSKTVVDPPIMVMIPLSCDDIADLDEQDLYCPSGRFYRMFQRMFIDKIISSVDNSFRTKNDYKYRALGGMGTSGTFSIIMGLEHPHLFKYIISQGTKCFPFDRFSDHQSHRDPSKTNIFYLDCGEFGSVDQTKKVSNLLTQRGYSSVSTVIFDQEDDNCWNLKKRLSSIFTSFYGRFPLGSDYENNYSVDLTSHD